jgi:hypothetical protein
VIIWMLYVIVVSLILGAAALMAERAARHRGRSTRGFWFAAILASLLLPATIASVSVQLPRITPSATPPRSVSLREVTSLRLIPVVWPQAETLGATGTAQADAVLRRSWLAASAGLTVLLIFMGAQVYRRKRLWHTGTIDGVSVFVTPDIGPAVVGLLRPTIVIPDWLRSAPAPLQSAVIAHEQSHVQARDPQLFAIALTLLIAMPWNLPLWWQLHRLRRAIEVDCDARVLAGGHDVARYGDALITVGQRQYVSPGAVAAMSESPSFLEQRIAIMMRKTSRWSRWSLAGFGALSVALVAVAAQVSPPNEDSISTPPAELYLPESTLDRYVGTYQTGETQIMTVTRAGRQLSVQVTGQSALEVYPSSETHFIYKVPANASIDFDANEPGPAKSLTIHQNGADVFVPRVDAAKAQQVAALLANRVQSQAPAPGSQAALQRMIDGIVSGQPNYDEMQPLLAAETRKQLPALQKNLTSLGAQRSIEFRGVGNAGWDVYHVTYERGSMDWRITLDSKGIIRGALVSAGP